MEDRAKWIIAKYRWYGFVDEVAIRSDMELLQVYLTFILYSRYCTRYVCHTLIVLKYFLLFQTMNDAIKSGSVLKVMYAVSLKAQANCFDPATLESPLHLAFTLRQPNIFGYLLLVRTLCMTQPAPHGICCLLSYAIPILYFVLQNGADLYHTDSNGQTVLDLLSAGEPWMQPFDVMTSHILRGYY